MVSSSPRRLQRHLLQDGPGPLHADDDLLGEASCLPDHPAGRMQQCAVGRLQLLLALLALGTRRPCDLQHLELHAAAAVAQLGPGGARNLADLPHSAGQHPDPISQKARVGRVVDVGLHHRRVHAHPPSRGHPVVPSYCHHSFVNPLDHLRPDRRAPAAHGLGVGHLAAAHAGEVAVHQVGAHLALHHLIAPVAHMLEDQQAQDHLRRYAFAAPAAASGMALPQSLVHSRHDLFVGQHPVGSLHPVLTKIAHFLGDQPVAEAQLGAAHLNHASSSRALRCRQPGATGRD